MKREQGKMTVLESIKYTLKLIWSADKGVVVYTFFKNIEEEVFLAFITVYMIEVIFLSIEQHTSFKHLVVSVSVFCLIHFLNHINAAVYMYYFKMKSIAVYQHLFKKIISKAKKIELSQCEKSDYYDKLSRSLDECLNKATDGMSKLAYAVGSGCSVITSVIMVMKIDYKLVLFICVPVFASLYFAEKQGAEFLQLSKDETFDKRTAEYVKRVFYEKKYASEIRLYNIRNILFKKQSESYQNRYGINQQHRKKISLYQICDTAIYMLFSMGCSFLYVSVITKKNESSQLASYVAVLTVINYICWKIKSSIFSYVEAGRICVYMNNLKAFMEYNSDKQLTGEETLEHPISEIVFDHVGYCYNESNNNIINDLSISIKKGEKIALVGENGAGKTTLIKLILGLYRPNQGSIYVNGKNIEHLNIKEYQKHFGVVFQDFQIFSVTLAENVLGRKPSTSEERNAVINALNYSQFEEELGKCEKGIDTIMTKEFDDSGVICSSGQAQKIAIARIFAKECDVSILDEPSSALDPISEYRMYQNLLKSAEERTVIFISHRLSSAKLADKIYFLEQGHISESGTHDELIKQNGKYAKMFNLQAQKYAERRDLVSE